jgi:hypothetical protein
MITIDQRSPDTGALPEELDLALLTETKTERRRMWRSMLILAVSGVSISMVMVSAFFQDTASVPNNAFTTGEVDIASPQAGSARFTATMEPGDVEIAPIVVSNDGTMDFRYALRSITTGDQTLAGQLELRIKVKTASTATIGCDAAGWATFGDVSFGPTDLGAVGPGGLNVIGDPTAGHDGNNDGLLRTDDRLLDVGDDEVLCFHVTLPSATTESFDNESTTASFDFLAEQTANNP